MVDKIGADEADSERTDEGDKRVMFADEAVNYLCAFAAAILFLLSASRCLRRLYSLGFS